MNAAGVGAGIVFVLVGVVIAIVGLSMFATCGTSGGATTTGASGGALSYSSGCGGLLFLVGFGILSMLLGLLSAVRAARTARSTNPQWNRTPPPPIFAVSGAPLPPMRSLPMVRCPYCRTLLDPGPVRCPSCGAHL